MKYVSLFTLLTLISNVAFAAEPGNFNSEKFNWSLAAMGDTINTYYKYYTGAPGVSLSLGHLVKMGDLLKQNSYRSRQEIIDNCVKEKVAMINSGIYCGDDSGCIRKNQKYQKNQKIIEAKHECNAFVEDLTEANKKYTANVLKKPGTYVKKTDKCGGQAYKIVNVVPGKDTDNKIYLINDNGGVLLLNHVTQKNGTFINETSEHKGKVDAGHVRGVYNNSYIFFTDVTQEIYRLYNNGRGTFYYSVGAGAHLMPGGDYDFKKSWSEKSCDPKHFGFRVSGQKDADAHTNGVLFNGQVVTLEDLGHIITGMHEADSIAPKPVVEITVEKLQGVDIKKNLTGAAVGAVAGYNSPVPGGLLAGAAVGAWNATPSAKESPYANNIRAEAKQQMQQEKDDVTFAKTSTKNSAEAYSLARGNMAKKFGLDAKKITCSGDCNTLGDDFVTCYYKNGSASKVMVYKFDDICNNTLF